MRIRSRLKERAKTYVVKWIPLRLLAEFHMELDSVVGALANQFVPSRVAALSRARSLRHLKVEIGSGPYRHDGWYRVDYRAPEADLRIDIRRGLPFADGSCRFIFCEHVFEHLELGELRKVLRECYRVLEPGGAIRIIVPDLEQFVKAYRQGDTEWVRGAWGRDMSPVESLNEVFSIPTHRFIHDFTSLEKELCLVGFSQVYRSGPRQSRFPELSIDLDEPTRRLNSLYVEAVR